MIVTVVGYRDDDDDDEDEDDDDDDDDDDNNNNNNNKGLLAFHWAWLLYAKNYMQ